MNSCNKSLRAYMHFEKGYCHELRVNHCDGRNRKRKKSLCCTVNISIYGGSFRRKKIDALQRSIYICNREYKYTYACYSHSILLPVITFQLDFPSKSPQHTHIFKTVWLAHSLSHTEQEHYATLDDSFFLVQAGIPSVSSPLKFLT